MKTPFFVLSTIMVMLITFYFLRRAKNKKRSGTDLLPPGPRGLPLLGFLPFLRADLHVCLKELADVHGPVVSLRLGAKLCVVLTSPESAMEALKGQDAVFANHDTPAVAAVSSYGCLNILWAPYGPHWRMVRKVAVRELLSPATLEGLYDVRMTVVKKMVEKVKASAGELVNLRELVTAVTMNSMMGMLWGGSESQDVKIEGLAEEFRRAIDELIVLFGAPNISDFYPALAWLDLQGLERRTRKLSATISRVLDGIIQQRLTALEAATLGGYEGTTRGQGKTVEESTRDFLQVLLDLSQRPDLQSSMTTDVIKAVLLDMVAAGTDTTTATMEWAMAELLYHPDKMKTAKEEITDVVGMGNIVEEAHLPRLRYLNAVFKETLRLHPVLPLLVPHYPSSDSIISGYTIPKGTKIFINTWAIQRDYRVWEDATKFIPERFLTESSVGDYNGGTFRFLPFGAGRRVCAGISLGERMVMFVLASLLHSSDWVLPGRCDAESGLKEKFGLVMKKREPLCAIPTNRELEM
ncbi:cytochrome P450 71A1-like [Wolffia australiana]